MRWRRSAALSGSTSAISRQQPPALYAVHLPLDCHPQVGNNAQLVKALGFSDADFAVIRTSSVRLTAEMKTLDAQAAAIIAADPDPSATSIAQLSALTIQRETVITDEISYLKRTLPPDKIAAFESHITLFFAPKKFKHQTSSTDVQAAPAAVQQ